MDESYSEEREIYLKKLNLHTVAVLSPILMELLIKKKVLIEADTGASSL